MSIGEEVDHSIETYHSLLGVLFGELAALCDSLGEKVGDVEVELLYLSGVWTLLEQLFLEGETVQNSHIILDVLILHYLLESIAEGKLLDVHRIEQHPAFRCE